MSGRTSGKVGHVAVIVILPSIAAGFATAYPSFRPRQRAYGLVSFAGFRFDGDNEQLCYGSPREA